MKDNCRVDRLHFGTGTGEVILKDACLRSGSFVNAACVFPRGIHIHFQEEK
jgi:hypothetical protein